MKELKDFIAERFSNINLELLEYFPNYTDEDGDPWGIDEWDVFEALAEDLGAEWMQHGASKIVFAFEEYPDVVIKIPFAGNALYDDDDEFVDELFMFENVDNPWSDECWNHCQLEADLYTEACKRGLDKFFFSTEKVCQIDNTYFYVSERANSEYERGIVVPSWQSKSKADNPYYNFFQIDKECLAVLFEQHEEEEVSKLVEFLDELCINDFHCRNFGYNQECQLCLLDYSGYKEEG